MVSLDSVIEKQDTLICINLDSVSALFTAVTWTVSHFFNLLPGLFASTPRPLGRFLVFLESQALTPAPHHHHHRLSSPYDGLAYIRSHHEEWF